MLKETLENKKIINNAISAYLLFFISSLFLFNKDNKYLNNYFVKSHTKVAFILHTGFLLTLIIFNIYSLGDNIIFFGYALNNIIAGSLFIILFMLMLLGMYRAYSGKTFALSEIKTIKNTSKLIDITGDGKLDEKDKLTIILSYIPFIGYIVAGKYFKNPLIKSISKFNLIVSFIIALFYILGHYNIANLFSLFYIIFVVFASITVIAKNEIININLPFITSPEETYNAIRNVKKYLKNYFSEENFIPLKETIKEEEIKQNEIELENEKKLETKAGFRLAKYLIYIPFINFIFVFFLKSKYRFHIINGIYLTLFLIITIALDYFGYLYSSLHLLFLFPIFYGIGYLRSRPAYKMPFVYICYEADMGILRGIKNIFTKTNEVRKKEENVSLKPKTNNKKTSE